MTNPMQQVQDDTIRLIVIVSGEIHTLVWVTNPESRPLPGTDEADNYQHTGWYYDQQDIPFFCGQRCQAAATFLRAEIGG